MKGTEGNWPANLLLVARILKLTSECSSDCTAKLRLQTWWRWWTGENPAKNGGRNHCARGRHHCTTRVFASSIIIRKYVSNILGVSERTWLYDSCTAGCRVLLSAFVLTSLGQKVMQKRHHPRPANYHKQEIAVLWGNKQYLYWYSTWWVSIITFFNPQTDFVQCLGHSALAMHDSGQKRPTLNLAGSEMFEIETGTHDVVFGRVLHDAPCNSIDRCVW